MAITDLSKPEIRPCNSAMRSNTLEEPWNWQTPHRLVYEARLTTPPPAIADDLNEPLPAELKIAYYWCRLAFIGRIPDENCPDRDGQRSSNGRMLTNGR
jgi:hypothetical protein